MKKKLLTIAIIAICCRGLFANAQIPDWHWAVSAGGASNDNGNSICSDEAGNVIVVGWYDSPSITFGTNTLINAGLADIFIVKYSAIGNVLWAKSVGGISSDMASSVCTDAAGNVFITGWYDSPAVTFGTTTLISAGFADIFTVKLDANGNVIWAKSAGGLSNDLACCVSTDTGGSVIVTGNFNSAGITFGTTALTNTDTSGSFDDVFVVKYDAQGNLLWATKAGGSGNDRCRSISSDASGNLFITGDFDSPSMDIGTTTLINAGFYDLFVAKYDAGGNVLWAKSAGGISFDYGMSISTDTIGNAIITGGFDSPFMTFDTTTLANAGSTDIFIVKYDAVGNLLWATSAGDTSWEEGRSVSTDAIGNVFVSGDYNGVAITFGTTTISNVGSFDIYVAKYDANGNALWAKSQGGIYDEVCNGISSNANGNVFITGWFRSPTIAFGTTSLMNVDNTGNTADAFIAWLDGITGIANMRSNSGVSIYPNPAKDLMVISYPAFLDKDVFITIADITGKIVYKTATLNSHKLDVNITDFAEGVYLLQIQTEKLIETRKVIISK